MGNKCFKHVSLQASKGAISDERVKACPTIDENLENCGHKVLA